MSGKRAGTAFFISIILMTGFSALGSFFPELLHNIYFSNFICETVAFLPVFIMVLQSRENLPQFFGFHKVRPVTLLLVIPFTFFSMPLLSLVNLFSQLFVKNVAIEIMDELVMPNTSYLPVVLMAAVFAPFMEECICRGAFYHSFKRSGGAFPAMLFSALIFALIHMNLNQASYAFVMGILAVILVEATGSIWSSILYHCLINGFSVFVTFLYTEILPVDFASAANEITPVMILGSIAVYLVITAVTLPIAGVFLWLMTKLQKRTYILKWFIPRLRKRKVYSEHPEQKKNKMLNLWFICALVLCVGLMIASLLL